MILLKLFPNNILYITKKYLNNLTFFIWDRFSNSESMNTAGCRAEYAFVVRLYNTQVLTLNVSFLNVQISFIHKNFEYTIYFVCNVIAHLRKKKKIDIYIWQYLKLDSWRLWIITFFKKKFYVVLEY